MPVGADLGEPRGTADAAPSPTTRGPYTCRASQPTVRRAPSALGARGTPPGQLRANDVDVRARDHQRRASHGIARRVTAASVKHRVGTGTEGGRLRTSTRSGPVRARGLESSVTLHGDLPAPLTPHGPPGERLSRPPPPDPRGSRRGRPGRPLRLARRGRSARRQPETRAARRPPSGGRGRPAVLRHRRPGWRLSPASAAGIAAATLAQHSGPRRARSATPPHRPRCVARAPRSSRRACRRRGPCAVAHGDALQRDFRRRSAWLSECGRACRGAETRREQIADPRAGRGRRPGRQRETTLTDGSVPAGQRRS